MLARLRYKGSDGARRILPEIVLSIIAFVALSLTLAQLDTFERLYMFTRQHEQYELDEVIAAFFALPAILLMFIYRRVRDLQKEIGRRTGAEDEMRQLAQTDPLTSLPNRRFFFDEIARRLRQAGTSDRKLALLHIDLDRFKQINDTLGHAAGDYILKYMSNLLRNNFRACDLLARIGGDEFLIAFELEEDDDIEGIGERLVSVINRPFNYRTTEVSISASVGIAICDPALSERPMSAETLLMNADISLYKAKDNGGNRYEIFKPALRQDFEQRTQLADDILRAVSRNEFFAVYQPLIDASTFEVVGVEALVRWNHPVRGELAPAAFIGMAQSLGVLAEIDQLVFVEALKTHRVWQQKLPNTPRISVNVSAERLKSPDFIRHVRDAEVQPGSLIFEISEAVIFEELDDVSRHNLDALTDLGIEIEIDDFGSGRASILSLLEMHPRRLKIDRNLTRPVTSSRPSRQLISSIIDMADSLGIEVVAEGVETLEHAEFMAKQGCTLLQGYFFAKPMSAEQLETYILANSPQLAASA